MAINQQRWTMGARNRFRALFVLSALLGGCHTVPPGKDAVDAVAIQGVPREAADAVRKGIATQASPQILFLPQGAFLDYSTLEPTTLERDLLRIERELRRHGYYEAKVRAARLIRLQEGHVRVELEVQPGPLVHIDKVETTGLAELPFEASEVALNRNPLRRGDAFDEGTYEKAQVEISNALADIGYAFVKTSATADVDLVAHSANVRLHVSPGPAARLGAITIVGLQELPESGVRGILQLVPGATFSRRELELARSALVDLGVFGAVELIPDLSRPESGVVPIVVRVEEAPLRSALAGIGATMDVLRLSSNLKLGWTNRNFLGGLRKLTVAAKPALTFFPTRIDRWEAPTSVLPENSLSVILEQPGFVEGRTRGYIESAYNIYPLLYPLAVDTDPRLERIIGYNEVTAALGARRSFGGRLLPVGLSLNWRANFPFAYQGSLADICGAAAGDRCGLDDVIVFYPELQTDLDLRDDPIQPTKGIFLSNNLQVAIPALGGQLQDVRIRPELRAYLPLDYDNRVILAGRVTVGMAFPQNYGGALTGGAVEQTTSDTIRDQHRLLFRAFYSGGPQSNRGYPYQRIGPQGPIGFLIPTGENCGGASPPPTCIRPLGGFSLWEASLELRFRTAGPLGFVLFADASDVDAGVFSFQFQSPHLSIGPGLRYQSPVGPIRVDAGFRVPGLQKLPGASEQSPDIADTAPYNQNTWDQFALHILIGEAF